MSFSRIGIYGLLLCIPLFLQAEEPPTRDRVRFAPLPMEGKKILQERFYGLVGYIDEVLEDEVEVVDFLDYAELLDAFREDRVDLAFLGPLPYALLSRSDDGVEPVVCFREPDGATRYTCSLVASGGQPVDLANARELHIGLTQPYSTCGYHAVSQMLKQAGRSLQEEGIRFSYAGNHTSAALGVARGEYDLAGVKTVIAQRYRHLDLQVVAESQAFPGFGLYANRRRLSRQSIERLRQALLRFDPATSDEAQRLMRSRGGSLLHGTSEPGHCDDTRRMDLTDALPPGWSGER